MSIDDYDDWVLRMQERNELRTCPQCQGPFEDGDETEMVSGYEFHAECAEDRQREEKGDREYDRWRN